jgi:uncharacterized protein YndB with AHSA1/START domain
MALSVSVSRLIAAPPDRVFPLASDFARMPERIPDIKRVEMLTDGPVGVGTKFKETRVMFGKEATETMEVTEFDPPHMYQLRAESCGARYDSVVRFDRDAGGTLATIDLTVTPLSFAAKLMQPLGWMMKGMMTRCFAKDLDGLAKAAETLTSTSSAAARPSRGG